MTKQPDYCIKRTDGYVYPYTPEIAIRGDMIPFVGTLNEAKAKGEEIVRLGAESAEPVILGAKPEPVEDGPVSDANADRTAAIAEAIKQLNPEDNAHYTQGGIPRVEAVENALGDDIEAWERDKAWSLLQG